MHAIPPPRLPNVLGWIVCLLCAGIAFGLGWFLGG